MQDITLAEIGIQLAWLAGIITSMGVVWGVIYKLYKHLRNKEKTVVLDELHNMEEKILTKMETSDEQINKRIDELNNDIIALDVGQCKNYLVRYISDVDKGVKLDSGEEERAYEAMDRYTNILHQNSYIHKRWEEVVEGKGKRKRKE